MKIIHFFRSFHFYREYKIIHYFYFGSIGTKGSKRRFEQAWQERGTRWFSISQQLVYTILCAIHIFMSHQFGIRLVIWKKVWSVILKLAEIKSLLPIFSQYLIFTSVRFSSRISMLWKKKCTAQNKFCFWRVQGKKKSVWKSAGKSTFKKIEWCVQIELNVELKWQMSYVSNLEAISNDQQMIESKKVTETTTTTPYSQGTFMQYYV